MEPLFETSTQCTYEEYKKFSRVISLKEHKFAITFFITEVVMFCCGLLSISLHLNDFVLFCFCFVIIYPVLLLCRTNASIKKTWNSNQLYQNSVSYYYFYGDHMEQKNELGTSQIPYDKLYRILETKTNFYLLIAKNQGVIIKKENCSEELIDFLKKL